MVSWMSGPYPASITKFIQRPAIDAKACAVASKILADVRTRGDKAVTERIKEFDGALLPPDKWHVKKTEFNTARETVKPDFITSVREAHKRIIKFARAGEKHDWTIFSPKGGVLGEQFAPLKRVGIYIPGGRTPLVSTALMTVPLAKAAGVPEIVVCSPVDSSTKMSPHLLYALEFAGATEIYKIGGIQAIGAMAYGTKTIAKVQKIVGPGGPYVTAAKRCVYGTVALDLVAGPSEIAILADESAQPEYVAADLLSQAEHGSGMEKLFMVTSSANLASAVRTELLKQTKTLKRRSTIIRVLNEGTLLVIVNNLDKGIELCNRFAPEHMEIMVRGPRKWLKKVRNAGAVFIGAWSPECIGDYIAGPSHVLPTGATAKMFSGLFINDFRKRTSTITFTRADLQEVLPVIKCLSRVESFSAHAKSAQIRFNR